VEGIDLAEDERASPREINHFSHPQHKLILINEKLVDVKHFEACIQFIISIPFYGCAQCNFFLHYKCTKLPTTIKRGLIHRHPLTLLSQDVDASGLFWCLACRRIHLGFSYTCDECKWPPHKLDVQCCLIPEILEHEGHHHSLDLVIRSFTETCNGCSRKGVEFRCTHCNEFTLCLRCATLPLVARYEYHTHLLKLSYTREDDSNEEYYCLICEEERDHPDHWYYSCVSLLFILDAFLERIRALVMEELLLMKIMSILSLLSKRLSILLHVMHVVSLLLTWPWNAINVNLMSTHEMEFGGEIIVYESKL